MRGSLEGGERGEVRGYERLGGGEGGRGWGAVDVCRVCVRLVDWGSSGRKVRGSWLIQGRDSWAAVISGMFLFCLVDDVEGEVMEDA